MAEWHPLRSKKDLEDDPLWQELNQKAEALAKSQPTAPLPDLNHLTFQDYQQVYEPADDTYLLLDALQYELESGQLLPPGKGIPMIVLEIGCGSGVPSVFFRMQWKQRYRSANTESSSSTCPIVSFVTDVNPIALRVTKQTALANGFRDSFEAVQCDLASAISSRLTYQVQVLLFNPPYVPTPDEEVGGSGIEASWAGGVQGRRVIDRSMEQIAQILSRPDGVAYLITVDDNRPFELSQRLAQLGLDMKPLFRRRAHNEYLTVQKITWRKVTTTIQEP